MFYISTDAVSTSKKVGLSFFLAIVARRDTVQAPESLRTNLSVVMIVSPFFCDKVKGSLLRSRER